MQLNQIIRADILAMTAYKVTDVIDVTIAEVRMETRSIIARPVA